MTPTVVAQIAALIALQFVKELPERERDQALELLEELVRRARERRARSDC